MPTKYVPSGDKFKASQLWGEGRHQLSILKRLMAFQGLKQLQRITRFEDGTIIKCLSCFAQDVIEVFVPIRVQKVRPRYIERLEINYYPAFEAYDSASVSAKQLGYVLCKGGGFNPPYEFIAAEEKDTYLDPFEWGRGYIFNDYQQYDEPGSTLEDYLLPKFLFEEFGDQRKRELYDIPPIGTKNRAYLGTEVFATNISMQENITRNNCCWLDAAHSSGSHQYAGHATMKHEVARSGNRIEEFAFCISQEGENYGFERPEEHLTSEPFYKEDGLDYDSWYYKTFGTVLPIFAGSRNRSGSKTGVKMVCKCMAPWMEVTDLTCDDLMPIIAGVSCPAVCSEHIISTFSISYNDTGDAQTIDDYRMCYLEHYQTSAEDESHYSFTYPIASVKQTSIRNVVCSGVPCGEQPEGVETGPYDHVFTSSVNIEDSEEFYLVLSDEVRDVSEYIGTQIYSRNVRYLRVGGKEFSLSNVYSKFGDGNWKTTYFFAAKSDGESMAFAEPVTLDGWFSSQIPDVVDSGGNQVYTHGTFRLIREEIKTIKEVA